MPERRRSQRREARIVLGIEAGKRVNRAGVTCDVSATGLAFRSPSKFQVGQLVKLSFRDPSAHHRSVEVFGTVVRTGDETEHYLFRHTAAVKFNEEVVALDL